LPQSISILCNIDKLYLLSLLAILSTRGEVYRNISNNLLPDKLYKNIMRWFLKGEPA